jgi:hypothetical protein
MHPCRCWRYAKSKNIRWWETKRLFDTNVLPRWRDLDIADIKRTTVITGDDA